MKKTIKSFLAIAVAAFAFTACSDVPAPYQMPGTGGNGGGNTDPEGTYVSETFETSFGSFTNVTVSGNPWVIDFKTAKATGYDGSATTASEAYLVSSPIDLSASNGAYLEFEYILRYVRAGQTENKVLVTANYTGNPTTTTWTDITGTLTEGSNWTTFSKYQSNLPAAMIGQSAVVIAMYYSCTTSSSTIEIKNLKVIEGSVSGGGDDPTPSGEYGTAENPINVAKALEVINGLEDGKSISEDAYVKGTVVSVDFYDSNHKSITYYIADDANATTKLQVYSGKGLNGADFAAKEDLSVGAIVVVKGKLKKYVKNGTTTPEIDQGSSIVSITNNGGTPTPSGDEGSIDAPKTVAEVLSVINGMEEGATTSVNYFVKGKVAKVSTAAEDIGPSSTSGKKYKDINYYISADGSETNTIYVYRGKNLNNTDFTSADQLKVGDEVIVYGKLQKYKNNTTGDIVPEIASGNYLVKTDNPNASSGGGESGGGTSGGGEGLGTLTGNVLTLDCAGLGLANNPTTITLVDGTTLTLTQNDGKNAPAYNSGFGEIRLYARNSFSLSSSKSISSVKLYCTANQGTPCVGNNGEVTASSGNLNINSESMIIEATSVGATSFTLTNGFAEKNSGGVQIRFNKMEITY